MRECLCACVVTSGLASVRAYVCACASAIARACVHTCACACVRVCVRVCRTFFFVFLRNKKKYIQYNTVYNFLRRKENRKIWLLYKIAGKENESKMSTRKTVTSRVE